MTPSSSFAALEAMCRATRPQIAIVLGSGMAAALAGFRPDLSVAYRNLPGMPAATVHGHRGVLSLGEWARRPLLVFEGRVHRYEGCSWDEVCSPVRVAHELGVGIMLHTNAAGGIRDDLASGSLMLVTDHIEWTRPYCWREPGTGDPRSRPLSPYSTRLGLTLRRLAADGGIALTEGVYASVLGPSYETPAEIRALKAWGADAVGMSTAREVGAAADAGMECAAVSCVTNRAAGLGGGPLNHDEVLTVARQQGAVLARLLEGFTATIDEGN